VLDQKSLLNALAVVEVLIVQTIADLDEVAAAAFSTLPAPDAHGQPREPSRPIESSTIRRRRLRRQQGRNAKELPLTERERQVVLLIGRGYTNEQIAAELNVVKGTVATHIQHLLTKLDFTSRVQVATWAVASGLLDGTGVGSTRTNSPG